MQIKKLNKTKKGQGKDIPLSYPPPPRRLGTKSLIRYCYKCNKVYYIKYISKGSIRRTTVRVGYLL